MFHNRTYQSLPYLVAHTLCEPQNAMTGNPETQVRHKEALKGQSQSSESSESSEGSRGHSDALCGHSKAPGGCPEVVGRNQEAPSGNPEAPSGNLQAPSGNPEAPYGHSEGSSGNPEAPLTAIQWPPVAFSGSKWLSNGFH